MCVSFILSKPTCQETPFHFQISSPGLGFYAYINKDTRKYTTLHLIGQDLTDFNPDPEFLQAAVPKDQEAACPYFPGVKPLQAEAKNNGLNDEASQTKGTNCTKKGNNQAT
ncbi:hypothetical protein DSO57_1000542 [Entomophthora muscae]|uniref:Uncharacterized protein n=1 Tax=Entomophthora muscae TaxID=34485 RepID=A0ACC2RPD9_9FUNG|nr:hypothetical protein DSO57_1000542 [Entomophthora muscae]